MKRLTRREMMFGSAGVIAGIGLAGCACPGDKGGCSAKGFKIGACDWTLGKQADVATLELAKRIGIDGVQVSLNTLDKPAHLQRPEVQKVYLAAAEKHGIEIPSVAIGELNNVPLKGDDPRAEQWVCDSIEVCKAMNIRRVLLAFFMSGDINGDPEGTNVVVERLKRITPRAEKAGVALAIESWLSAEEHLDIIERVGSPAVKVYYDVGNSQLKGYDICKEIRMLGDHIVEFHAKDYDDIYGKGSMDFAAVRQAMDDIGYRGWLVMEGVKMPLGTEETNRYDAEYLRKIFPKQL